MLARDMFKRRLRDDKEIYFHEFMYPLMQGYDCVAMDVDGELGGNDQMFNMLAGRTLMKAMKGKEKFVLTTKLLVDPTGKKMGKSEGNMIRFSDSSDEMFGKVMSWSDEMIVGGFELMTDVDLERVEKNLQSGMNPRDLKVELAREVVAAFYGADEARDANDRFDQMFKEHSVPDDVPELKINGKTTIVEVLMMAKFAKSKSDARRLIDGGGVKVNDTVVSDHELIVEPGSLVQKGKRHFVRLM
jgi:tyrosyl-tRNA synthetase